MTRLENQPYQDGHVAQREQGDETLSLNERVLRALESEARSKIRIVLEGPPIYLWPALQSQQWDSPAFNTGWEMVNELHKRLPIQKTSQYILIDDMNSRPTGIEDNDVIERTTELFTKTPGLRQTALGSERGREVKLISELALATELDSEICSVLDAAYNTKKITDQMEQNSMLFSGNPERIMLVVINPNNSAIRAEQLNMFQALYGQLRKQDHYSRASKADTRNAITHTFRHVWLDEAGNTAHMTKPAFIDNNFRLVETSF